MGAVQKMVDMALSPAGTPVKLNVVKEMQRQYDSLVAAANTGAERAAGGTSDALATSLAAHRGMPGVEEAYKALLKYDLQLQIPPADFAKLFVDMMQAQASAMQALVDELVAAGVAQGTQEWATAMNTRLLPAEHKAMQACLDSRPGPPVPFVV